METAKLLLRTVRGRYIIALSMVALLLSLSAVGIQLMLKTSKGDAEVINIAGMQRMLSQKIALFSHHIYQAPAGTEELLQLRSLLLGAVERFEKNHWFLIQQSPQDNAVPHLASAESTVFREMNGRQSLRSVLAYIEDNKSLAGKV